MAQEHEDPLAKGPLIDPSGKPATTNPAGATQGSGIKNAGGRPGGGTVIRRYPAPPSLLRRVGLLVIRPEQWPEMARYPLRFTVFPLITIIIITAMAVGISKVNRMLPLVNEFVSTYDKLHPPMIFNDGKLSAVPTEGKTLPRMMVNGMLVVVDPTGKTSIDSLTNEQVILVDAENMSSRLSPGSDPWISSLKGLQEYMTTFGVAGPIRIDQASMTAYAQRNGAGVCFIIAILIAAGSAFVNSLWALAAVFLVAPLVMMGAPQLRMPRRVAYRIAAATTIPLIALDGILTTAGFSPAHVVGGEFTPILWFSAAAGLAFWAGHMAGGMYTVRKVKRPG